MTQVVVILEYDEPVPDDICENLVELEIQYEGVRRVTAISGLLMAIRSREENLVSLKAVDPDR